MTGAVFVGEGSWQLTPANEGERRHLALVGDEAGLEVVSDRFESLVLLFTDGTEAEIRRAGSGAGAPPGGAAAVWDDVRRRQRRELRVNLQILLLAGVFAPDEPASGVFLAFVDGRKLPPAIAVVDPAGLPWLPDVSMPGDADSALYVLHERKGGCWYLARRKTRIGTPAAGAAARAEHYDIDTTIQKNADIRGETTIRLRTLAGGVRVLPLFLLGRLRIREAAFARGEETAWTPVGVIQEHEAEDSDAAVVFPETLGRDETIRLRIAYGGEEVLRSAGDGNFVVGARESWYPNLGVFQDSATYELTYRLPKRNDIVSVGVPVENRIEGDTRIAVWKADEPIRVAGFNYGTFKKLERSDEDSGLRIQVFTNPGQPDIIREIQLSGVRPEKLADSAMADGINTARVGSVYFGPLPFGHVAITQQSQWFFGQSWPSLVFLPYVSFLDSYNRFRLGLQSAAAFVDMIGPHEFAHQWWGHLVGWDSYRDQWLSEGFAEFTAGLVIEHTAGPAKSADFWERARKNILEKPATAFVSNNEAGPITEGWRLATWRNFAAGQAMIYDKGGWVVQMLRMLMREPKDRPPDGRFIAMMKDFVTTYSGRNPSTRDFQTVVERHMSPVMDLAKDGKMDWFFRQWVAGMEIPRYVSKIKVESLGGDQYKLTGTVTQENVSADFLGFLPLYLEFDKGVFHRLGVATFRGLHTVPVETTLTLPKKPRRVVANAMSDVLTRN